MSLATVDHLVYAVPNVEEGARAIAEQLGVEPSEGGPHPGLGTRNVLLSFEGRSYLEVIGPDPEQGTPSRPRPFGIDELEEGRLVTWAVGASDLAGRAEKARAAGYDPGQVVAMSRRAPSGLIEWELTIRATPAAGGLVPFLIDWGLTPSPALSAARGCRLVGLRGEHPDPASVEPLLDALGATLEVDEGPAPALVATIESPHGTVELR